MAAAPSQPQSSNEIVPQNLNRNEMTLHLSTKKTVSLIVWHSPFPLYCNHIKPGFLLQFLANNTAAILYLTDTENYGRDSVSSQYFMQLAQYVRLPMISWNADNSAYEMGSLQLQLAPTIKQQASAMLTILDRYSWKTFSIVTGKIAGHHNFEIVRKYDDHLW